MSWFSNKDSTVKNFHPVTSSLTGFGELTEKDTTWACTTNRGFQTETHTWYSILSDGSFLMIQVIWSYTGIMFIPATAQMTFKHYSPKTKEMSWKSVSVGGFKPNGRGCKSDSFEIKQTGTPSAEEKYIITANLDNSVQISATFIKPATTPGFKYCQGEQGGISTFGTNVEEAKRDGFVVHRFLPFLKSEGSVVIGGKVVDIVGDATFIHAIQGMRPDSLASRWNFGFFTTGGGQEEGKLGSVRAIQMEFETTDAYGPQGAKSGRTKVNIGAIYTSTTSNPLLVTGQTSTTASTGGFEKPSGDISSVTQTGNLKDKDTGYAAPGHIKFVWKGDKSGAEIEADQGINVGENGLIEKVDVLAEIPYVIRKGLAAVTGTKPYIYQYMNPTTLNLTHEGEEVAVKGWLFNEATFVSL